MLKVAALAAHYGGITALAGVDLEVQSGELVALLGCTKGSRASVHRCTNLRAVDAGDQRPDHPRQFLTLFRKEGAEPERS